ncbi:hypothetical protein MKW98_016983 [Papaver atlanticum]|uniref:Uncharacterized protein n=1 Tax=Papaver atlanticum TaxID=357466 RepID=A0AAD4THJ1_9MAGN|nr:hypothetical protein MKW98_016983 [Papaver atlanticum]
MFFKFANLLKRKVLCCYHPSIQDKYPLLIMERKEVNYYMKFYGEDDPTIRGSCGTCEFSYSNGNWIYSMRAAKMTLMTFLRR